MRNRVNHQNILLGFILLLTSMPAFAQRGSSYERSVIVGPFSQPFFFTDTKNACDWGFEAYGSDIGKTIHYQITLNTTMDLLIHNFGSALGCTEIKVYGIDQPHPSRVPDSRNVYREFIRSAKFPYVTEEDRSGGRDCFIIADLPPGTYIIISCGVKGSNAGLVNGPIRTSIRGYNKEEIPMPFPPPYPIATKEYPIDLGSYSTTFSYHDVQGAFLFTNTYRGEDGPDIFYKFEITHPMNVTLSNNAERTSGSHLYLLDALYHLVNSFSNDTAPTIIEGLAAGTYYVVSEGDLVKNSITTNISGTLHIVEPDPVIEPIGDANQNFIHTRTYMSADQKRYMDAIQYYDGLGRPIQTVQKGITPTLYDLANYQEYDGAGRESSKWLPVVLQNNNGAFVSLGTIKNNINASYPDEAKPYTLPVYEVSPLNRVLEQYGPGQAWQDNSRSAKTNYLTNIADNDTLNCIYYKVEATSTDTLVTITNGGNYATGKLYVTRGTDEDGNASFEFKDKLGQVVLTRQIGRNGTAKTIYDTYYIYDDFGNLAAVLPPLASDGMKSGTSWTNVNSAILRNYAYLYMYDGRSRCKAKRLPGCSWNYYVYDTGDRLIFSQDAEQRKKGEWGFTLPDIFSRTCATGICKNSFSALAATPPLNNVVVKVTRDNTTGTYKGYTLSGITLVSPTVLNVSYYDDYAFMGKNGIPDSIDTDFWYEPILGFGTRYTGSAKTFLTGTLTAKLDGSTTPTYLYSVMYYDYRGRVIQTKSNNQLTAGIEKEYVAYNFTGQPTQKKHIHSATGKTTQTEIYSYDYDHAGRLLTVKHKLNSGTNTGRLVTLVKNIYDELGRLKTSMKDSLAALTTTYAYNVRSWMKSSSSPLFSQTLYYNDSYGSNTPCYNGNISAMSWTTSGDKTRGYNFTYDNLSRLTAAGYLEGGVTNKSYGTSYAYDKHGNMTNLVRNGRTGTSTFGTIDNLSMSYAGNQLIKADDAGVNVTLSESMDFKNNSTAAKEYFYDLNGNLTQDLNKGIKGITYNLLNLPQSVSIANTLGQATNTYTYAADGRKLRTLQQWSGTNSKQTDYVGNVIYENGSLKRILVDGGYIEGGAYYFYQTDHLGNNRVVANASGGMVQTNHYYPFGMSFAEGVTANGQPYKYNGKELDTERGLNLYDYSARLMDPALGRFSTVDPLAEKYYSTSPYVYCKGNPVNAIDPDGCSTWVMTNSDGTSRVVGGDLNDKDKNIYTYSIKDGNLVRGESIGTTTSMTSFYNSDKDNGKGKEKGGWASGSVINPNDKSGDDFLGNMFGNTPPMFDGYMANAGNGGKYDFKVTNGEDKPISGIDTYRGMPVGKNANGQTIYTSARDVGNMAAGFVAGANGMAWGESRIAFDAYQSKKSGRPDIEGISTRNAEYYGWRIGASNSTPNDKIRQLGRSITSGLKRLWDSF